MLCRLGLCDAITLLILQFKKCVVEVCVTVHLLDSMIEKRIHTQLRTLDKTKVFVSSLLKNLSTSGGFNSLPRINTTSNQSIHNNALPADTEIRVILRIMDNRTHRLALLHR